MTIVALFERKALTKNRLMIVSEETFSRNLLTLDIFQTDGSVDFDQVYKTGQK